MGMTSGLEKARPFDAEVPVREELVALVNKD